MRKTYGVSGLVDWRTTLKAGKARVNVHFSGGAMTKYGVTPAEFTTSDPVLQRIIEGSCQFKTGRICLLRKSEG